MRDSFVFYRSFWEAIKSLPDDLHREVVDALVGYALDGATGELSPIAAGYLSLMRPQIDANNRRYENGKLGGRPKTQTETKTEPNQNKTETSNNQTKPKQNLTETTAEPNVNVNVNVNDNKEREINKEREKSRRFTPPTPNDVQGYCNEKGYSIDVERFVSYYESNGWRVGRNPMKDWRAAVRTWATKDRKSPETQGITRGTDYDALIRRMR